MVVPKIVFTLDPRHVADACKAVRDSERVLAAHGRCRRWCVVRSGPNELASYAYYDGALQAEAAPPQICNCLRASSGAFADFSKREVRDVVFDRTFDDRA